MRIKTIVYWATTLFVAFLIGSGGIMQTLRTQAAVEGIVELGYPVYFVVLLGIWKALGAAAILAPRFPLLKEWAYAGIVFDLSGAAVSHAVNGSPAGNVVFPTIFTLLAVTSWALRPGSRRIGDAASARTA
ncbi:MAG: DoxX family protein [Thermoanaerobaculia bacterium]